MKTETVKNKGKIIAHIHLPCVNYDPSSNNKEELITRLSEKIEDSDNGYAGFSTKKNLNDYLREAVFDKTNNKYQYNFILNEGKIIEIITKAVKKCSEHLFGGITDIFVFPTFNQFVREEMFGVTGYTPWQNTILVFLNPTNLQWEKALSETIGHEFNHTIFLRNKKCTSLLDSMVFEGLAEHFREQIIGGDQAPWTKVFNLNQAKVVFSKMRSANLLSSTDPKIRRGIFFGNKKYVRWTGYTIGYHVVGSFLRNDPNSSWQKIMIRQPADILDKSSFNK